MIEFEVYDKDLKLKGILDNYKSCLWRSRFYEAGCFEIIAPVDENNLYLLGKYSYVVKGEDVGFIDTFLITKNEDGEVITVSGVLTTGIINREVSASGNTLSGLIDVNCITTDNDRIIPHLKLGCIEEVDVSALNVQGRDLQKILCEISRVNNIGFKLIPDIENKFIILSTYKGVDRSYSQTENPQEVFSEEFDNLLSAEFVSSDVGSYNVIRAILDVPKDAFYTSLPSFSVGNSSGFCRREKAVQVSTETYTREFTVEGITIRQTWVDYNASLEKMKEATFAALRDITENFDGDVFIDSLSDCGWKLGDTVTVESLKWGISIDVRICETEEFYNHSEDKVSVTFGSPIKIK